MGNKHCCVGTVPRANRTSLGPHENTIATAAAAAAAVSCTSPTSAPHRIAVAGADEPRRRSEGRGGGLASGRCRRVGGRGGDGPGGAAGLPHRGELRELHIVQAGEEGGDVVAVLL